MFTINLKITRSSYLIFLKKEYNLHPKWMWNVSLVFHVFYIIFFSFSWKDGAIWLKCFYGHSEIHFLLLHSVESFLSDNSLTFRILYLSRIQFLSLAFPLAQFTFIHLPVSSTPPQDALSIILPSSCRLSIILPSSCRRRVGWLLTRNGCRI